MSWEERMSAKAHALRKAENIRTQQEREARMAAEQAEFARTHPDVWVEHERDECGMEIPLFSHCTFCWEHDNQGRTRLRFYEAKYGGTETAPIQTCSAIYDWSTCEWSGCTCYCHRIDLTPIALASASTVWR